MGEHEMENAGTEIPDLIPAPIRSWLYGIMTAAIPLLTAYGVISEQDAPLWAALVGAVLATSTALAYRPTRKPKEGQ